MTLRDTYQRIRAFWRGSTPSEREQYWHDVEASMAEQQQWIDKWSHTFSERCFDTREEAAADAKKYQA